MTEAYFGLPGKVMFCRHCVISNQRPSSSVEFRHQKNESKSTIGFDENGVCDACRYHEVKEKQIDWSNILPRLRKSMRRFDPFTMAGTIWP